MVWDWENHDIFSSKESSIESSFKEGMEELSFSSEVSRSFRNTYSNIDGSSPSLEASVCTSDHSIGLKLGKRTCCSPSMQLSCVTNVKKVKLTLQSTPVAQCQVDGCNLDLSSAKEYHKKHRVCKTHSKSSQVVLDGVDRRFCQQCSRFHGLSEFDGKKRSCRQRLSDHNARRRKPQKETIHFNSRSQSSSFSDAQHQISFVSNHVPLVQTEPALNSIWETTCKSHHTPGVFHQGSKAEGFDFHRAPSLLSSNSWGSCDSGFSGLDHPMHKNGPTMAQHGMHLAHHGSPPEYWRSVDHYIQESHVLKEPYGYY